MVILELIHAQGPERGGQGFTALFSHAQRDVFIRLKTSGRPAMACHTSLVIHSNSFGSHSCPPSWGRRRFIQISALSTFDGRIEAYHGRNG